MGMTLQCLDRRYEGDTAVDIVLALAKDAVLVEGEPVEVRSYVEAAIERLEDLVHRRELATAWQLSDEAVAFNFLCLLDEYGLGRLRVTKMALREEDLRSEQSTER